MSKIDDGGSAFPHLPYASDSQNWSDGSSGMSLRDWFAGMALQQFVDQRDHSNWAHENTVAARKELAKAAYNIADAMLEARKGDSHDDA